MRNVSFHLKSAKSVIHRLENLLVSVAPMMVGLVCMQMLKSWPISGPNWKGFVGMFCEDPLQKKGLVQQNYLSKGRGVSNFGLK
jgi:hypothetical protein